MNEFLRKKNTSNDAVSDKEVRFGVSVDHILYLNP